MVNISDAYRAAGQLKAEGRWTEAIDVHEAIARASPADPVAFHNLAAILGDVGRSGEAERAARHAMRLGLQAPETLLVCARAVQAQGRFEAAEELLREALKQRPHYLDALRDLAQLRWMCTASSEEAVRPVDTALQLNPGSTELILLKSEVLNASAQEDAALGLLRQSFAAQPAQSKLAHALAYAALQVGCADEGLAAAQRSLALAPDQPATHLVCIDALLAVGEWPKAEQLALAALTRSPFDQHMLARLATVWRLRKDARYFELCDYDGMVSVLSLATPPGWSSLQAFLSDLAAVLHTEHRYRTHPFQQSIRQGSQVPHILQLPHAAAQGLASAIDVPIREHLSRLGRGTDPLRVRNENGYVTRGSWSIRMKAGGRHVNHVHAEGWISSACYVEAPLALAGRQGCLKLGEPGIALNVQLPPERLVEPQLGRIVLFPSYMWHGTVPFVGDGVRMSAAFDLVPAHRTSPRRQR